MVIGIIGSLELSSLVPGTWRLSTSMVIQAAVLAVVMYVVYKIVSLVQRGRRVQHEFGDMPGPEGTHWLFGSFYYVSIQLPLVKINPPKIEHKIVNIFLPTSFNIYMSRDM